MPDYKKKKWHKTNRSNNNGRFEIPMNDEKKVYGKPNISGVIKKKKTSKIFKLKAISIIALVVALVIIILNLIFPVGIIETISTISSSIGTGNYPIKLDSGKVESVNSCGNYYYCLSDAYLISISNSGKVINKVAHGLSSPILKTSKTRALLYDLGQPSFAVYGTKSKITDKKTDFGIIAGDAADNGYYAVSTYSDEYASSLFVFDKTGKSVFKFNCAKETINSVTISPRGDKVAISTINSVNGELSSKLHIFNFKSPDAEKTFDYSGVTIYNLNSNKNSIFCTSNAGYDVISWKNGKREENKTEQCVDKIRVNSRGALVVLNRENDRSDNRIIYISNKGEKKCEFEFSENISDIRLDSNHIYCIGNAKITIFDLKGDLISSCGCEFDYRFISPTGSYSVDAVSDNEIQTFTIKGGR